MNNEDRFYELINKIPMRVDVAKELYQIGAAAIAEAYEAGRSDMWRNITTEIAALTERLQP